MDIHGASLPKLLKWSLLCTTILAALQFGQCQSSAEVQGGSLSAISSPRGNGGPPIYTQLPSIRKPKPSTFPTPSPGPGPRPKGPNTAHTLPTFFQRLDFVVKEAYATEEAERNILMARQSAGIDKLPSEFAHIAPPILGSVTPGGVAGKVSVIAEASRVYNWIKALAHPRGFSTPLDVFLVSRTARDNHLSCPFTTASCQPQAVYRTVDGQCNNVNNHRWGSSFIPLSRDLPPKYDAGYVNVGGKRFLRRDLPRQTGRRGSTLPSARYVSNVVHSSSAVPRDTQVTMLYTNYGQTLSHDLSNTPMEGGFLGAKLNCCHNAFDTRRCAPIQIPNKDFFRQFQRSCINFFRSAEVTDVTCSTGVRQQLNAASSFIDGTQVYGHFPEALEDIRDKDGLLTVSFPNHLPLRKHPNDKAFEMGINVLKSGDEKVSESTGLIGVVTLWYREHNRIAKKLATFERFSKLKDKDKGRFIFEEARKIVIAEMQHVTYNEYLPITVGPTITAKYKIKPQKSGYFTGYNPYVDATISNEFATASFRFGHSMIRNEFSVLGKSFQPTGKTLRLKKIFWRSNFYLHFENGFQRGVLTDASEVCDRHLSVDLRNHMFETKDGNGLDLASLNIQRGRDHGLSPYADYRKLASLSVPYEWSADPTRGFPDMDAETIRRLRAAYRDPADIDLWSGGISEIPVLGGQVGPLFARMIAKQFVKIKIGDRFWYENKKTGFSLDRLNEIRKVSMARIMCNNLYDLEYVQPNAFVAPTLGGSNDRVRCSSIPDVNLDLWK